MWLGCQKVRSSINNNNNKNGKKEKEEESKSMKRARVRKRDVYVEILSKVVRVSLNTKMTC